MFIKTGKSSIIATSDTQLDLFNNDSNIKAEKEQEECGCSIKPDSQTEPSV